MPKRGSRTHRKLKQMGTFCRKNLHYFSFSRSQLGVLDWWVLNECWKRQLCQRTCKHHRECWALKLEQAFDPTQRSQSLLEEKHINSLKFPRCLCLQPVFWMEAQSEFWWHRWSPLLVTEPNPVSAEAEVRAPPTTSGRQGDIFLYDTAAVMCFSNVSSHFHREGGNEITLLAPQAVLD